MCNPTWPDELPPTQRHRMPTLVGAVILAAAMAVLTVVTVWSRFLADTDALRWLDVAVGVLAVAAAPVLLWRPVPAAVLLTALAVLSPAATPAASTAALLVAQRRPFPVAAAVGAGGIAAQAVQGAWRPPGGLTYGWWLVLIVAAYGALVGWGALARARRALIRSLRERARRAEAEQGRRVAEARAAERARIAGEMHDVLAHRLSLIATYAGALEYRPDASAEQRTHAAGVIRTGVHQALEELREVISVLRDDEHPDTPPQPTLADLARLVEESRAAGMRVRLADEVADAGALPAATGRTAYRVVQEALTNARKHAAGEPVQVTLTGAPGDRLVVEVTNPLPATPGTPVLPGTGTGLIGLTERVRLAGGELDHGAAAGWFRLHAWLAWPREPTGTGTAGRR
ncbi:sensor histidine kinase [Actinocatenispora sera]|uniref:sensor histidine kinase n=1 Tax=Actinocatenispora sera TaxID=390989 RepID=UPI001FD292EC|nr:histidine kinase [Actinocatenispora sera]